MKKMKMEPPNSEGRVMQVKTWKPAPGCPACRRAEQMFQEHTRISSASHARALAKAKEQAAEIKRLRALLSEAAEDVEHWGSYADEYFQDKHDLGGDIEKFKKAARGK